MFVASFVSLPVLAVATASVELSKSADAGFFAGLSIDDAMWEALTEGALALLVFGAASAIMGTYRKKSSKNTRAHKGKFSSVPSTSRASERGPKASTTRGKDADAVSSAGARPPSGLQAAGVPTKAIGTREADAIASAVKTGKTSELPR